jgi:hypothetical protein
VLRCLYMLSNAAKLRLLVKVIAASLDKTEGREITLSREDLERAPDLGMVAHPDGSITLAVGDRRPK